jgi:SAM-dependent methyltransferase
MSAERVAGDPAAVIWHDVECGAYDADLPLWEELAAAAGGTVLELGCGTGRVALHLARRGHPVVGIESNPELVACLAERAEDLPLRATAADACDFRLDAEILLVLAPMQLMQLLADAAARARCLRGIAAHLKPGGIAALAIAEDVPACAGEDPVAPPPLPDTREVDGRVYSSLPLPSVVEDGAILVRRRRQTVAPDGRLDEVESTIRLSRLSAERLEREATAAGLEALPRRRVPTSDDHVGSTVVILRRGVS